MQQEKFGIIFNLNAIVSSEPTWRRSIVETGQRFGINFTKDFLRIQTGHNLEDLKSRFTYAGLKEEDFEDFVDSNYNTYKAILKREGLPVKPHFFSLIDFLRTWRQKERIGTALATHNLERRVKIILDHARDFNNDRKIKQRYFDAMIIGSDIIEIPGFDNKLKEVTSVVRPILHAPDPEIYWAAAERIDALRSSCFIADSNFSSAAEACRGGAQGVWISDNSVKTPQYEIDDYKKIAKQYGCRQAEHLGDFTKIVKKSICDV